MYKYNAEVEWIEDRRTMLNIKDFHLEVDSPPEFNGPADKLTPEELMPGILASCLLTTFLEFKDRMNIHLYKWSSKVDAVLAPSPEKGFRFESIHVHIVLKVNPEDKEKIPRAIELAQKYCFVSRAVRNNLEEKVDFEFVD